MDISLKYRRQFLENQAKFNSKYRYLFDKVAQDVAFLAGDPSAKFTKSFQFSKSINDKMTAIIEDFNKKNQLLTEQEISRAWDYSNAKNDEIVNEYLKNISEVSGTGKYFLPNLDALRAFISRDGALSDSIWMISEQLRAEMEIHLGIGIMNGDSAGTISRRIRQYLNNPDSLFRRVRDKKGNLVASKAMKANAPGQGVYNSAFKNAMRTARTETNRAYLLSDSIRWNQIDFVIKVKVSLSAQHPDYKFPEICEELEGVYPKDYVFMGFHPQCLCHATPILSSEEDFRAYLRGEKPLRAKQITKMPDNFISYIKENYEKYSGYKSMPLFIQDNEKIIAKILKSN